MEKVAIVGLGRLDMPLTMSLAARDWQVTGSETTLDGVEAVRMGGIESYSLRLEPELVYETNDLNALMDTDALVVTLPTCRSGPGKTFYLQTMQELVNSALVCRVPWIIFANSTSVYDDIQGTVKEETPRNPVTASGRVLKEPEDWLYDLPGTSVGTLHLAGLVDPERHPDRLFIGKTTPDGHHGVNLVHLDDVVSTITLLLQAPKGGHIYNACTLMHPACNVFYPQVTRQLGVEPPEFRGDTDSGRDKVIDGNCICNELGFEYQYPGPLVMPMKWRSSKVPLYTTRGRA